ncbi:MAG: hypothetical protein DMF90_28160, partial [Acidobacteria bacterium]
FEAICKTARVHYGLGTAGGFTFHRLRAHGASKLLSRGTPIHTVQRLGGWRAADTLLRIYATSSKAELLAAVGQTPPKGRSGSRSIPGQGAKGR